MFHEAPSSNMPPSTATPSSSNTMPPPLTPSNSNTMPPPTTPSGSNTMPPLLTRSGSNTMPPPTTSFGSNITPSHATPGSNTSAGSNTMPSHAASASTGRNKGKCPLIPKKRGSPTKSSASISRGGSRGGASKRGRGSNTMPLQGLKDESSYEEHQFKIDMEAMYKMEREQIENDEDDQFWEDCAREFDHVEEPNNDKGMPEDVYARKQPMIEDDSLQVGADLPTQESTIKANPKPTRSKKSKPIEDPNQRRIFNNNGGSSERIFN
ncbi:hypothetical protein Tco_0951228 [Tanacetum coccineum]|uniref:Uncharacterized protein n=1 Tax=Tanacetum coccineum TaxID=301880 RepID=A0ABQ5DV94_9ASTR